MIRFGNKANNPGGLAFYNDSEYEYNWDRKISERKPLMKAFLPLAALITHLRFSDVEVHGAENVPDEGGFVLVTNHMTGFDSIAIAYAMKCKRPTYYMAKEEFFHAFYTRIAYLIFNAFPVKRDMPDRQSLRFAKRVVDEGVGLTIFIQGTRDYLRRRLSGGKAGAAMIIRESEADVLPVCIHVERNLRKKRPKCIIRFGDVIPFDELGFTPGKRKSRELKMVTAHLMEKIGELWDKDDI